MDGQYSDYLNVTNKDFSDLNYVSYTVCYKNDYQYSSGASFSGVSSFIGLAVPTPTVEPTRTFSPSSSGVMETSESGETLEVTTYHQ